MARRGTTRRAAAAGLAAALLLAACGDDDEDAEPAANAPAAAVGTVDLEVVAAAKYANEYCRALNTYSAAVQKVTGKAVDGIRSAESPEQQRAAAQQMLTGVSETIAKLQENLREAGAPDIDGGDEAARRALEIYAGLPAVIDGIRTDLDQVPLDGSYANGALRVLNELGPRIEAVISGLTALDDAGLKVSSDEAPQCAGIG